MFTDLRNTGKNIIHISTSCRPCFRADILRMMLMIICLSDKYTKMIKTLRNNIKIKNI